MNRSNLPEVCLNLWWVLDAQTGVVQRLAGRPYALSGTDPDKTTILKSLAATDFHLAKIAPVPEQYVLNTEHGQIKGAIFPNTLATAGLALFEHVILQLEESLPRQIAFRDGKPFAYKLKIPPNPLFVMTCIEEQADGQQVTVV